MEPTSLSPQTSALRPPMPPPQQTDDEADGARDESHPSQTTSSPSARTPAQSAGQTQTTPNQPVPMTPPQGDAPQQPSQAPAPVTGTPPSDLAARLNTVPQVVASNRPRAEQIAAQAEANRQQQSARDNGIWVIPHHVERFAAGAVAGAGAVAKGAALLSAGLSEKEQERDEIRLKIMGVIDLHKNDPDWTPLSLLSAQDEATDPRINIYWHLVKNGDDDKAQAMRDKVIASYKSHLVNHDADPSSYGAWQLGQSWQDMGDDPDSILYGNPAYRDWWSSRITYGAGYAVPAVAATAAAGLATGPGGATTVAVLLGASTGGSSEYDAAIAAGATPHEALEASRWGALVGAVSSIPIGGAGIYLGGFLRRLGQQGGPALRRTVYELIKDVPPTVALGAANVVAANLIAQGIYDPKRGFLSNTGSQMESDAISALAISAFGMALLHMKVTSGKVPRPPKDVEGGASRPGARTTQTPAEKMLADAEANSVAQRTDADAPELPASHPEVPVNDQQAEVHDPANATDLLKKEVDQAATADPTVITPDVQARMTVAVQKLHGTENLDKAFEAIQLDPKDLGERPDAPSQGVVTDQNPNTPAQGTGTQGAEGLPQKIRVIQDKAAAARNAFDQPTPDGKVMTYQEKVKALPPDSPLRPENYLGEAYIKQHLSLFDEGAARFQRDDALERFGPGQRDHTAFVLPKKVADILQEACKENSRCYEVLLGLPEGQFGRKPFSRVDFTQSPKDLGVTMTTGLEAGANSQWRPGGYTDKGIPEAVLQNITRAKDQYDQSSYRVTQIRKGNDQ